MTLPTLTVAMALLGAAPEADAPKLVKDLGSVRFAEREKAAKALESLGERALPALRDAIDDKDAEVRARATALRDRIEVARLLQPTLVRLDVRDRPATEVFEIINAQARCRSPLVAGDEPAPFWDRRRITASTPGPVPFWKAIDLIQGAGRLRFSYEAPGGGLKTRNGLDPVLSLVFQDEGEKTEPAAPPCDTGPFRVSMTSLIRVRNTPEDRTIRASFEVMGEPHLMIAAGAFAIEEAVDEKGQSLLPPMEEVDVAFRPGDMRNPNSGTPGVPPLGSNPGNSHQFTERLVRPARPGKMIKSLRGSLPVAVAACKAGPLVIPLAGAKGKTFRSEGASLEIKGIEGDLEDEQVIDLVVRLPIAPVDLSTMPMPMRGRGRGRRFRFTRVDPPDFPESRLEVADEKGRTMRLFIRTTGFDEGMLKLAVGLRQDYEERDDQKLPLHGEPTELRLYGLASTPTVIRFEFHDIPMP